MIRPLAFALLLGAAVPLAAAPPVAAQRYGLIGRMVAVPGQRDALIAALLGGTAAMPGCLSYVVAKDAANPDAIWITEVWIDRAAHDASLALPAVRRAIRLGRPLIAAMDEGHETVLVGGTGLPAR